MISDNIHILTDDDLRHLVFEAEQRGWQSCRKWHLERIERIREIEQENALSDMTADAADVDTWLADMNR